MWPAWVDYTTNISHLATVFNSSINFYIYIAKHSARLRPAGRQQLLSMRIRVRLLLTITNLLNICYRNRAVLSLNFIQS